MCYLLVARAKKRGFVDRILKAYCTDYHSKNKKDSKITNRIIRKRLKYLLQKEIDEYKKNNIAS